METDMNILTMTSFFDLENSSAVNLTDSAVATLAFEKAVRVVVPVIFTVIVLLGFVGNLLVIVVVAGNRQMRSTTNLLIICLATADLTFIVICVPFTAYSYAITVWPFGNAWCKIYQYVIHVTAYVSVYTLVLMSFDRYLAVVHPIGSMTLRTTTNTLVVIVLYCALICGLSSFSLLDFEVYEYQFVGENRSACLHVRTFDDSAYRRRFYGCFFAFAYIIPLGLVCLLYGLIIRRLVNGTPRLDASRSASTSSSSSSSAKKRSKRRVTSMVVAVVVVFAVCWFPFQFILLIQAFETFPDNGMVFISVKIASSCLAYVNSCVNPFLYAFLSDSFRKGFRNFLRCGPNHAALPGSELVRLMAPRPASANKGNPLPS